MAVSVAAQLVLDAGGAVKTMKDFKAEIKQAREDLINIQATFGATSKEAFNAAKRVAELQDNLKEANETAQLFDPGNKFQVIGNAVRGLVGGFTALQGALALVGVEGEDVQKTLVKVQSALALTEGLNTIADVGKDFKRLGSILVQTLGKSGAIGLAIAGVAALTVYLADLFSSTTAEERALKELEATEKDYARAAGEAKQKVIEVQVAFDLAKQGVIKKDEALRKYNETLGDSLGRTNNLATAEKNLNDKAEDYIRITGLKAQANALFAKAAEQSADALIKQQKLDTVTATYRKTIDQSLVNESQRAIDDIKKEANIIEGLGADLLKQAGEIAAGSKINANLTNVKPQVAARVQVEKLIRTNVAKQLEKEPNYTVLNQEETNSKLTALYSDRNRMIAISEDEKIKNEVNVNRAINEIRDEQEALENARIQARIEGYKSIGNAAGALADLIGKQTAAGKVLAISQAVINTWLGVTEVLKTKSTLPEPLATISRIANVATVIATGLAAVKNITKTQVAGAGATSAGSALSSATPAPLRQVSTNNTTTLDQQSLQAIGNATVRAFVVESDITNNQQRIRTLNRAARI